MLGRESETGGLYQGKHEQRESDLGQTRKSPPLNLGLVSVEESPGTHFGQA